MRLVLVALLTIGALCASLTSAGQGPAPAAADDLAALKTGVALLKAREFDRAIDAFDKAIKINPQLGLAYHGRGIARQEKGLYGESADDFTRAMELGPAKSSQEAATFSSTQNFDLPESDEAIPTIDIKANFGQSMANLNEVLKAATDTSKVYAQMAKHWYAIGDYDNALTYVNKAIHVRDDDASLYTLRARIRCQKRDFAEAIKDCNKAIRIDRQIATSHYQLGECLRLKGDYSQAIDNFRNALTIDPAHASSHYKLALTNIELKDYDWALSNLAEALQSENREAVLKTRADLYQTMERFPSAIADYSSLIAEKLRSAAYIRNYAPAGGYDEDRFYRVLTEFTKNPYDDPSAAALFFSRGTCLQKLGELENARLEFKKGFRLCRDHTHPTYLQGLRLMAPVYLEKAAEHNAQKEYDQAIPLCDKLLEFDPTSADAYQTRGNSYVGLEKLDLAIADFKQAAHHDPTRADVYQLLGDAHFKNGQYPQAISCYTQILVKNPQDVDALLGRGDAYERTAEDDKAIVDYSQVIGTLAPRRFEAYEARGNVFRKKGQRKEAADDYYNALVYESDSFKCCKDDSGTNQTEVDKIAAATARMKDGDTSWFPYEARGNSYLRLGDNKKAIADFSEAARITKRGLPEPLMGLGKAYKADRQFDEAIQAFEEAAAANIGDDSDFDTLIAEAKRERDYTRALAAAKALAEKGEHQQAIDAFNKVAADYPSEKDSDVYFGLMQIYIYCADPSFRNLDEAMRLTKKGWGDSTALGLITQAMVYATHGDFEHAVVSQSKALLAAPRSKAPKLARRLADYMSRTTTARIDRPSLRPISAPK